MSRHRNVRNMDYDEEYDVAYDDSVYGRSVDDHEYGVSPSAEQYMYSRGARDHFGNYFEEGIDEDFEEEKEYQKPELSEQDEARLQSVLDHLRGILIDSVEEDQMIKAVIENKFDAEKSLDQLLRKSPEPSYEQENYFDDFKVKPTTKGKGKKKKADATQPPIGQSSKSVPSQSSGRSKQPTPQTTTPKIKHEKSRGGGTTKAASSQSSSTPATPKPVKLPTKQRDSKVDVEAEWKASFTGQSKDLLNLVVVGHVDAGKSTLTGHLLFKQGNVTKKAMHKYEQQSKKAGKQTMYAWVMDDTEEERARGITVDVAERSFETLNKIVNVLDAPGHKDFIPNMISGAAKADVAILVVDSSMGEFEAGFESNGQTREHAMLIKSLGVSEVAVAINKLDTVKWSEERYLEIQSTLATFLKSLGYKSTDVTYIPCSGLSGQNLTTGPTEEELKAWYKGPTVLEVIDAMKPPVRDISYPTRFSISDIFKGGSSSMCVSGKLHTGYIQSADKLVLMPHMVPATVKEVLSNAGGSGRLFAGDSGTLTLSNLDPDMLQVGNFLCDPSNLMVQASKVQARVVLFNVLMPIIKGTQVDFHHQALCEPSTVRKLISQINKTTGEMVKANPRVLARQSAGVIDIQFNRPMCVETYKDNKELGRFMLRQQGTTIAAGLVTEIKALSKTIPKDSAL